jgi:transposase
MCTTSEMRRIATRYDKLTTKYLAIIELPPIRIWLTATSVSGPGCVKSRVS